MTLSGYFSPSELGFFIDKVALIRCIVGGVSLPCKALGTVTTLTAVIVLLVVCPQH